GSAGYVDAERAYLLSALLETEAELEHALGAAADDPLVASLRAKALDMALEAGIEELGEPDLPQRVERLLPAVAEESRTPATWERLVWFWRALGRFARAEDALFAWLDAAAAAGEAPARLAGVAERLYADLELLDDAALEAGGLPRAELGEGRADLGERLAALGAGSGWAGDRRGPWPGLRLGDGWLRPPVRGAALARHGQVEERRRDRQPGREQEGGPVGERAVAVRGGARLDDRAHRPLQRHRAADAEEVHGRDRAAQRPGGRDLAHVPQQDGDERPREAEGEVHDRQHDRAHAGRRQRQQQVRAGGQRAGDEHRQVPAERVGQPARERVAQHDAHTERDEEVPHGHRLEAVDVGGVRSRPQPLDGEHGADQPEVHERDA